MDLVCPACQHVQPHPVNMGPPGHVLAGMGAFQLDIRNDPRIPWSGMHPCTRCKHPARIPDLFTEAGKMPVIRYHPNGYRFDERPLLEAIRLIRSGVPLDEVQRQVPGWAQWLKEISKSRVCPWLIAFVVGMESGKLTDGAYDAVRGRIEDLCRLVSSWVRELPEDDRVHELRLPEALLRPKDGDE